MSQSVWDTINPSTTSGNQLAILLNDFKNAVMSGFAGDARPSQTTSSGGWIDTSQEDSPNFLWTYKVYTGTTDISVFKINLSTNTASFSGSDSTFDITKISADAVGAQAKFTKSRIANAGGLLLGDVVGEIQMISTDNTGGKATVARLRGVVTEDQTSSAHGAYWTIEGTKVGTTTLAEWARFYEGNFGVGVTGPTFSVHLKGTSGIKSERVSDDTSAPRYVSRKARLTGMGGVANADLIHSYEHNSQDSSGTEFLAAKTEISAVEDHTSSARGTAVKMYAIKTGTTTLVDQLELGDKGLYAPDFLTAEAYVLAQQSIAVATVANLNADKAIVNFTGSSDMDLQGILATGKTRVILIHNTSTGKVTLKHQSGTASAANRLKLPQSKDIILLTDQSAELWYSTADSRWKLKSGSGSGGGTLTTTTDQTITGGGTITISTDDSRQAIGVTGSTAAVTASTTPFGSPSTVTAPLEFFLFGIDDTNIVSLPYNDADYGCIGNFGASIDIGKNDTVKVTYIPATKRFYVSRGA